MSKVRVTLNKAQVREQILKSSEVQQLISERAEQMAAAAGEGFEAEVKMGKKRCYANVRAVSRKAKRENYKNNTLLKVMR